MSILFWCGVSGSPGQKTMQGIKTTTITTLPSTDAYSLYAFTGENCPGSPLRNLMSSLFMHFHLSEIAAHRHQAEAASDCPAQPSRPPSLSLSLSLSFTHSLLSRSVEKCYNNIAAYYRKVSNVSLCRWRRPKCGQAGVDLGLSAHTMCPTQLLGPLMLH